MTTFPRLLLSTVLTGALIFGHAPAADAKGNNKDKYAVDQQKVDAAVKEAQEAEDAKRAAAIPEKGPFTKGDIQAVIKQYILDNPDLVMASLEKMREKQKEDVEVLMHKAAAENKQALQSDKSDPSVGNPNGNVTITEFYDYHCGYCKQVVPVMTQLLQDDKNVRIVFKDFPILSPDSEIAAKASIAFYNLNKDKFFDYHTALMKEQGKFDETRVAELASQFGVTADAMKAEMAKPAVSETLKKHKELGQKLAITGTPMIYVDTLLMAGAGKLEDLKALVKKAREAKGETKDDAKEDKKS
jgi:protein-disulfide isomerase